MPWATKENANGTRYPRNANARAGVNGMRLTTHIRKSTFHTDATKVRMT